MLLDPKSSRNRNFCLFPANIYLFSATFRMPINKLGASKNQDTLAKVLYAHVFKFIVSGVNQAFIFNSKSQSKLNIQMHDIPGFGTYKFEITYSFLNVKELSFTECLRTSKNQFEQLCINYTNEKIQNFSTNLLIRHEQDWYKKEGVEIPKIEFPGNEVILGKISFQMFIRKKVNSYCLVRS